MFQLQGGPCVPSCSVLSLKASTMFHEVSLVSLQVLTKCHGAFVSGSVLSDHDHSTVEYRRMRRQFTTVKGLLHLLMGNNRSGDVGGPVEMV